MKKYWAATILLIGFILYCAYAFVFFAWVIATPVTPENLKRAQTLALTWFVCFCFGIVAQVVVVLRMIRLRGKGKT